MQLTENSAELEVSTADTVSPSTSPPTVVTEFQTDDAAGAVDSVSSQSIESVTVDTTISATVDTAISAGTPWTLPFLL